MDGQIITLVVALVDLLGGVLIGVGTEGTKCRKVY